MDVKPRSILVNRGNGSERFSAARQAESRGYGIGKFKFKMDKGGLSI